MVKFMKNAFFVSLFCIFVYNYLKLRKTKLSETGTFKVVKIPSAFQRSPNLLALS